MASHQKKIELIDLKKYGFVLEPRYYFFGWSKSSKILGRKSAVQALLKAKNILPKGYNFKIWDCWRPRKVQIKMLAVFKTRLQYMHPNLKNDQVIKIVGKFAGPINPPIRVAKLGTHRNGGSFDITIIDRSGNELYMGTDHDDLTDRATTDFFESKKTLNDQELIARKNRRLLKKVLLTAGFTNYKYEWWHWSFNKQL